MWCCCGCRRKHMNQPSSVTGWCGQSRSFGPLPGCLPYTHPGHEGCPRKQLTLRLPYLLKTGVTSWIQTNQSWPRKGDTCVGISQPSSFLWGHVYPYLGSCGCCLHSLGNSWSSFCFTCEEARLMWSPMFHNTLHSHPRLLVHFIVSEVYVACSSSAEQVLRP